MKNDIIFIKHIFDAISKIERFIQSVPFDNFVDNEMMLSAVIRELEIVGEASNKISKDFQAKYHEIPWAEIIGMRNRLIHKYFGVDADLVWQTCQNNLPKLKKNLLSLMKSAEEQTEGKLI